MVPERELAELILRWSDAGADEFDITMRLAEVDSAHVRQAMQIVYNDRVRGASADDNTLVETLLVVLADHPDADGAELERAFRKQCREGSR